MRLIDYVDPSIGTTGSGKAIIGPQMPHGMCKLSPDTESLPNAGYDWRDSRIHAFSHNHLEGVGGRGGRGYIGIMPATGEMKVCEYDYSSRFSHDREEARVGYYAVDLLDYDIRAELTATEHCGFHRYTFRKDGSTNQDRCSAGRSPLTRGARILEKRGTARDEYRRKRKYVC